MHALLLAFALAVVVPPIPSDFIQDDAAMLDAEQRADVAKRIELVDSRRVALWTVQSLDGELPEALANRARATWHANVLLLVSAEPARIQLSTDRCISKADRELVIAHMVAVMKDSHGAGIALGMREIQHNLAAHTDWGFVFLLLLAIGVCLILAWYFWRMRDFNGERNGNWSSSGGWGVGPRQESSSSWPRDRPVSSSGSSSSSSSTVVFVDHSSGSSSSDGSYSSSSSYDSGSSGSSYDSGSSGGGYDSGSSGGGFDGGSSGGSFGD